MIRKMPDQKRVIEDHQIPADGGETLRAKLLYPRASVPIQRVVLMVPLVGASAGQPLPIFRNFARCGGVMVSYAYRGHPGSDGMFELDKTVVDTHHAMLWAADFADKLGVPLHAFAVCYGVIPMLAQFGKNGQGPKYFKSVNTVSGLFRVDQILRFDHFAPVMGRHLGQELTTEDLMAGIAEDRFDWNGTAFRGAVYEYLTNLFPELRIGRDYFEDLTYDRINIAKTLLQLSGARYLDDVRIPPEIPCNVYVGLQDNLLNMHTEEGRKAYHQRILSMIPHAHIVEGNYDHYGQGPEHNTGISSLTDDMAASEKHAIPAPHFATVEQPRRVPR